MKVTSLIYGSSAVKPFSEAELVTLLERCRQTNATLGITGLLLYKDGAFMQVLEGEERAVQKLYAKIEKDPRHRSCAELRWEKARDHRFPDWSMGFRNLDHLDVQQTPGYSMFMTEPLTSTIFQANPSRAQKLLLTFAS